MTEINDVKLSQLIPENLNRDVNVKACADALDPQLQEIALNVDAPSIYLHLDSLTSEQLDHMATQWDASVWRQSWPVEIKRNVINNVIRDKRKKGTLLAVKNAIESIGIIISITEWWQETPKATPHTFKVVASLSDFDYDFIIETRHSGKIGIIGNCRKLSYSRVRSLFVDPQTYDFIDVPNNSMGRVPMDPVAYSNDAELEESAIELVTENVTYENEIVSFADSNIEMVTENVTYENEIVSFIEEDPE